MRESKRSALVNALIAAITLAIALILHYGVPGVESEFWANIMLGLFGGAILTFLTAINSYHLARRHTLEQFTYHTRQLLHLLFKYEFCKTIEEKVIFFNDYTEFDKTAWDTDFGDIDFFLDPSKKDKKFIYNEIYEPIREFNNKVANYRHNFRRYTNGSVRCNEEMAKIIDELENDLFTKRIYNVPADNEAHGKGKSNEQILIKETGLALRVHTKLEGRFREIMYGKRAARDDTTSKEE